MDVQLPELSSIGQSFEILHALLECWVLKPGIDRWGLAIFGRGGVVTGLRVFPFP